MTPDVPASPLAEPAPQRIRFGIVLLPNFTLTAFSGFVDMLRLSADDGDYSKPVRCAWSVIGETLAPVRASCGIQITPWETFENAEPFDYVVVVGGLLHSGPQAGPETLEFIRRAGAGGATVVGICTGVFTLMRANVLDGYRTCVSWFHYWDFIERFPRADPDLLIADRLFVIDRRRITCSGGRASIDVAAAILLRHFDHATVQKALRILLVGEMQKGNAPQPHPPGLEPATHPKVKRASSDRTVADIASSCGFADASHLGREFRKQFGVPPATYRERGGEVAEADVPAAADPDPDPVEDIAD
nr:GlxA family transcriptional regulator [Burkholderia ambifaria]